ncbi:MAG: fatty acid desaturase [Alphaproteobacteria bacterium]|nr:fatty acid desaturase [Alphaproteobacteria bacterium]
MSGADQPASLRVAAAKFRTPTLTMSMIQLTSGFVPLLCIYALMYAGLIFGWSYWAIAALSLPAAGFVVRIFIFQHDCGHGSFFRSPAANRWVGLLCSVVTLTPYENWRRQHAGHHMHWNDLDNRNSGSDIYSTCLTVAEYRDLPPRKQLFYRIVWHPLVALVLLPPIVFLLLYRFAFDTPAAWVRERRSVYVTNAALAVVFATLVFIFGWEKVLLVHLPTSILAAIMGVWMFSLQHRFDGAAWAREDVWTSENASIAGSSHLVLPKILQWFTGNIGFHHIHHLDPRVPNYRLEACHRSDARFAKAPTVTLWQGLSAMRFCLWDEEHGRLIQLPSRPR